MKVINNLAVPATVALLSISAHLALANKSLNAVDDVGEGEDQLQHNVEHKEIVEHVEQRQMRRDPAKKNKKNKNKKNNNKKNNNWWSGS